MKVLLTRSRIYRAGRDEEYHQSNLLYDVLKYLASLARILGQDAREDIQLSFSAADAEQAQFFAYFAGVKARKAFSVAARVLDLEQERRSKAASLLNLPIDWKQL